MNSSSTFDYDCWYLGFYEHESRWCLTFNMLSLIFFFLLLAIFIRANKKLCLSGPVTVPPLYFARYFKEYSKSMQLNYMPDYQKVELVLLQLPLVLMGRSGYVSPVLNFYSSTLFSSCLSSNLCPVGCCHYCRPQTGMREWYATLSTLQNIVTRQ